MIRKINVSINIDKQTRIAETLEPSSIALSSISSLDGNNFIAINARAYPIHPPVVF